jgi:PAS domain S-box-containing protein
MKIGSNADSPGFEILFYANPQPMWIFDTDTLQIIEVNDAALLQYGYTKKEFLSKTIAELRPKEDINTLSEILKSLQGNNTNASEFRHQAKDGSIFFIEIHSYSIVFKGIKARLVYTPNIQKSKEIEQKLEITQSRLEKILETINIGFCQLDDDLCITYWNTAAEELIGYNRTDVIGKKLWDVLPEIVYTDFYNLLQWSIEKRENVEFIEYFWPLQKWLSVVSHPTEYGQNIHFTDSTSKIQFQKTLIKKIEQLKNVSYLNSHLIRKPIASLMGLTNLIRENIIDQGEFKKIADYIYECSIELDEVVNQVNNKINYDSKYEPLKTDLDSFSILSLLTEINEEFDRTALNYLMIADNTGDIDYYGNRQSIKMAIECLINNSIKYSSLCSAIILQADIVEQSLVISVQDFGTGIDSEILKRLFLGLTRLENFKNLGAGLTLVADVARNHQGIVWIESQKGAGSTFSLRFPLSNIAVNMTTGKPDFSVYKKPGVEIKYNNKANYIMADYKGFHDPLSMKAVTQKLLHVINEHTYSKLLVDNSDLLGIWDGAVEWIANEWFPLVEKAGITHIAVVYSKCTFTKVSADNLANKLKSNIKYKTFYAKDNAVKWLGQ